MLLASNLASLEPGACQVLGAEARRAVSSLLEDSGLLKRFLPQLLLPFRADVDVAAVRRVLQTGEFELKIVSLRHHRLLEAETLTNSANPTASETTHLCTPIARSTLVALQLGADKPTPPFVELTFPTLLPLAKVSLHFIDDAVQITASNGSFSSRPISVPHKENLKGLFTANLPVSNVAQSEPEGEVPSFLVSEMMKLLIHFGIHHLSIAKSAVWVYPHVDSVIIRRHPRVKANGRDQHARTEIVLKMHRATCSEWNLVERVNSKSPRAEILISGCGTFCPLKPHPASNYPVHEVNCIHRTRHEHEICANALRVELRTWYSDSSTSESSSAAYHRLELPKPLQTRLKSLFAAACRWDHDDVNVPADQRAARRRQLASEVGVMQGELLPLTERDLHLIDVIRTRKAGTRGERPPRLEWLNGVPMDANTERQIGWILNKIELPAKPLKRSRSASSLSSRSSKSSCGSVKSGRSNGRGVGYAPRSQPAQGAQATDAGGAGDDDEGADLDDEGGPGVGDTEDLTNTMIEFVDVSGVEEARRQIDQLVNQPNLPTYQRERGALYRRILDAFEEQSEPSAPFRGFNVRRLRCNYTQRSDGGRLYPQTKGAGLWDVQKQERRTIALQAAPRELRPFLAGRFCHDLDLKVCHPQIIRQLVHTLTFDGERRAFDTSELDDWCNNRDDYIEHIAKVHDLPPDDKKWFEYRKDCAKLAVLLSTYGGSYAKWKEQILVEGLGRPKASMVHEPESPRINRLHQEITVIRQAIFDSDQWCSWVTRDKERLRVSGKKRKKAGNVDEEAISRSTFSRVIHKIEDGILMSMRRFLVRNGHRTMSLQFDGLLVAGGMTIDYNLKGMSEAIQTDTGYKIEVLEKALHVKDGWPRMCLDRR
jgi:hypothetical protein